MVKKLWGYVYPFRQNIGMWPTDRQVACHGIVRAMNTRRAVKIETIIQQRRSRWLWHIYNIDETRIAKWALEWLPESFTRKPGRLKKLVESSYDLQTIGILWEDSWEIAKDRALWRSCATRCDTACSRINYSISWQWRKERSISTRELLTVQCCKLDTLTHGRCRCFLERTLWRLWHSYMHSFSRYVSPEQSLLRIVDSRTHKTRSSAIADKPRDAGL